MRNRNLELATTRPGLHVDGATEAMRQLVRDPETGSTWTPYTYASADLPISVHSDLSNINISLPDKPADKSSATAQKQ